jgi:hypothetical protein
MKAAFLILVSLLVAVPITWEFVPLQYSVWDGAVDLTVNVSTAAGLLRSVRCTACIQREDSEWALQHPSHPEAQHPSTTIDPFDGKPISVIVPVSGRESPCGRELSYRQWKYLLVVGRLQDGRELVKLVELPDCRHTRKINVSLP